MEDAFQAVAEKFGKWQENTRLSSYGPQHPLVTGAPRDLLLSRNRVDNCYERRVEGFRQHGEHEFGAVGFAGNTVFWRIDYYSPDLQHESEAPADPNVIVGVLAVMLAEEY